MIKEHEDLTTNLTRLLQVFVNSQAEIRPHFILTGSSGSGKSHTIKTLAESLQLGYLEINAAQLTKEGTSGNSLSKALAPLATKAAQPTVCFVDEFDKLFISGNTNSSLAHETTNGVQNEFLKVLESDRASVFGDYGKYIQVSVKNVLFVFAGAFNGEEDLTIDRLRDFGIKTEFLGRVGLVFNIEKLSIPSMLHILETSPLLDNYLQLFPDAERQPTIELLSDYIRTHHEKNTIGARLITTLLHKYFIKGELTPEDVTAATFQTTMEMPQ